MPPLAGDECRCVFSLTTVPPPPPGSPRASRRGSQTILQTPENQMQREGLTQQPVFILILSKSFCVNKLRKVAASLAALIPKTES